jgi:UDP-N-acetylmuramyl pentapeptide synthase
MVHNALAAAAAGLLLGVDDEGIRRGLQAASPAAGRMNVSTLPGGATVIDDTYNANPASMQAALEALRALRGGGRGMLVAGEMRELGAGAAGFHREVGRCAARTGVDRLYACGAFAGELAAGALEAGLGAGAVVTGSREEITEALLADLSAGDWVLVKGSRAAGMEAVVRRLRERAPGGPAPSVDRG